MLGCCSSFTECLTVGKCVRKLPHYNHRLEQDGWSEGPKNEEGDICQLWKNTISTPFPLLYALKQKGLIAVETNYLTELGEKYLFQKYWGDTSDVALVLRTIYVLEMVANNARLNPAQILAVVKITKGDVNTWLKNQNREG